ncbi:hypothetical protein [Bradyrhizobium japonicum]|uniref:hypothetical protein n=1 Tax=Bradyrhizobium japonicum TaxID=375 RepID=UPI00041454BE|nr:hypothetical protein [Bradyrhizobium japonicum]
MFQRTIVSAVHPKIVRGDYTDIHLTAWFEELPSPVPFIASLFDCEPHGRELWFRAMKGEYGDIEIVDTMPCAFIGGATQVGQSGS